MSEDQSQLVDAWDIHLRMHWKLFDAIPPEYFKVATSRGVGSVYAHLNNIRLSWIEVSAPSLLIGAMKVPAKTKGDRELISKELLRDALERSGSAMRNLLDLAISGGKVANIKPHLLGRYSYFIAHEWYHLGEIGLYLGEAGYKLDDKTAFGIWDWK